MLWECKRLPPPPSHLSRKVGDEDRGGERRRALFPRRHSWRSGSAESVVLESQSEAHGASTKWHSAAGLGEEREQEVSLVLTLHAAMDSP